MVGGRERVGFVSKNKLIKTFDISSYLSRPYGQIFSIIGNGQNILLLGIYDDGLLKFNTRSKHIERIPLDMENIDIISFYQDLDKSIWIGTEYGVYHYYDNMLHKNIISISNLPTNLFMEFCEIDKVKCGLELTEGALSYLTKIIRLSYG